MYEKLQEGISNAARYTRKPVANPAEFLALLIAVQNMYNPRSATPEESMLWYALGTARAAILNVVERHRCEELPEPEFDSYGDLVESRHAV